MKDEKNIYQRRYPIAVYSLIGLTGIIFILIPLLKKFESPGSLILNIGTELIGGALIFFVLHFFLLDRRDSMTKELQGITDLLKNLKKPFFHNNRQLRTKEIEDGLRKSNKSYFLGYALNRLVEEHSDLIAEKLFAGSEMRWLIVDGSGDANRLIRQISREPNTDHNVEYTINRLHFIKERVAENKIEAKISVRSIDWIPSCSLYIFDITEKDSRNYKRMQVEIYPPDYRTYPAKRPIFSLSNSNLEESRWFEFFMEQFEQLWNSGKEIEI